jgi:RND superfamily putative drug exporter
MVAVFLSFALGDERVIKEFGIGLATAIFIDATIIRLILVPALMQVMGEANWWFPDWLDRLVPRISIEAHHTLQVEPVPVLVEE